jgi:hypothetical protein
MFLQGAQADALPQVVMLGEGQETNAISIRAFQRIGVSLASASSLIKNTPLTTFFDARYRSRSPE